MPLVGGLPVQLLTWIDPLPALQICPVQVEVVASLTRICDERVRSHQTRASERGQSREQFQLHRRYAALPKRRDETILKST